MLIYLLLQEQVTYKQAPILKQIYDQMSEPKWVVSMGACACSGGFYDNYTTMQGIDEIIPVDVYVGGCPPRPEALLDALLSLQNDLRTKTYNPDRHKDFKGALDNV